MGWHWSFGEEMHFWVGCCLIKRHATLEGRTGLRVTRPMLPCPFDGEVAHLLKLSCKVQIILDPVSLGMFLEYCFNIMIRVCK